METYTKLNRRYKEEMASIRDFCFHAYVEPVLVEEEAIAQLQYYLAQNRQILKSKDPLSIFKSASIWPRKYPVRHTRFTNWYSFMAGETEGLGRGQQMVQKQIQMIQESIENISELQGNAGKPQEIRDLTRRLEWNELRNEQMKPKFMKKLKKKQIEL